MYLCLQVILDNVKYNPEVTFFILKINLTPGSLYKRFVPLLLPSNLYTELSA